MERVPTAAVSDHTFEIVELPHRTEQAFEIVKLPRKYFKKGRVFKAHWADPRKESYNKEAYIKVRWFVVIRPRSTHCVCLPITTYSGQGTSKPGVNANDHAALVKHGAAVQLHSQERKLEREAIAIIVEDDSLVIDPMARINFGKLYTVEYNLPVRTVGRISPSCLGLLESYFLKSIGLEENVLSQSRPQPKERLTLRGKDWLRSTIERKVIPNLPKSRYRYSPLGKDEIRLLLIYPGVEDDEIRASILKKSRDDPDVNGTYDALSYHWGSDEPSHPVRIIDGEPPIRGKVGWTGTPSHRTADKRMWMLVRDNLYDALSALRHKEEPVLLWVDAICINQDSEDTAAKEEKSSQVSQIARIYHSAKNVCIWLGRGDETSVRAMQFIKSVVCMPNLDSVITMQHGWEDLQAFTKLMTRKWFTRRWVLQEIGFAKQATVHCGKDTVSWEHFADAVAVFISQKDHIHALAAPIESRMLGAYTLVITLGIILRKCEDGTVKRNLGIEELVSYAVPFEASDPHDYIFALLALARDVPQKLAARGENQWEDAKAPFDIKVDYGRDELELFVWFAVSCIRNSKSLDIICRPWAPDVEIKSHDGSKSEVDFPSWIRKLSDAFARKPRYAPQGLEYEYSLVGYPHCDARKTYNAANGSEANFRSSTLFNMDAPPLNNSFHHLMFLTSPTSQSSEDIPATPRLSSSMLCVQGVVLANVKERSKRDTGIVTARWLRYGGWKRDEPRLIPDKLWRTLVVDRGPDGRYPPPWYRQACVMCLNDAEVMSADCELDVTKKPRSEIMSEYLERVNSVMRNRQFFLGDKDNVFGLGPLDTKIGDSICVLTGCSVPVILRRKEATPSSRHFEFIGEAYVYGNMDGEAMLKEKLEWFQLV